MSRALRIEYPGALYHVLNRGNYRQDLFSSEGAAQAFESTLFETAGRFGGWLVHGYVVMSNHYHLALETPLANLSAGVQYLQSVFANRFNRYPRERGHVFQGCCKALIIEPGLSLVRVVDYIHLMTCPPRASQPRGSSGSRGKSNPAPAPPTAGSPIASIWATLPPPAKTSKGGKVKNLTPDSFGLLPSYDSYSRPRQVSHFWRPKGMEYDFQSGSPVWHSYGVGYNYSDRSVVTSVQDTTGRVWWDKPKYDEHGRLVSYRNGHTGTYTQKNYDPTDHTLESIKTGHSLGAAQIQNLGYEFDPFGNLDWRKTTYEGQTNWEQFSYDRANRLLTATRSGGHTAQPLVDATVAYLANGNIDEKDGFSFEYNGVNGGVHAVTKVSKSGGLQITMGYDQNGRMSSRVHSLNGVNTTWSIQWTGFGKPYSMFKGSDGHKFQYDAGHNRIVHVRVDDNIGKRPV